MSTGKNINSSSGLAGLALPLSSGLGLTKSATVLLTVAAVSVSACEQQMANAEQPPPLSSGKTSTALEALHELPPSGANAPREEAKAEPAAEGVADEVDEGALRRGYGVVDMRANDCVSRLNDHTFRGEGCPSGFVIYGPYVAVPANSEIEVSFEVKSPSRVEIYADIVSQMGTQTLAGLSRQIIDPGANHKLGYRVHVFNADANVESRIGVSAERGVQFEISNLTMTVR